MIGVYAIPPEGLCRWRCFESDKEGCCEDLKRLHRLLADNGLTSCLEGLRRGGHLWLFSEEVSREVLRPLTQEVTRICQAECDIFP